MKAYKIELIVLDFDDLSDKSIHYYIENIKYVHPSIVSMKSVEIDNWSDQHILNIGSPKDKLEFFDKL